MLTLRPTAPLRCPRSTQHHSGPGTPPAAARGVFSPRRDLMKHVYERNVPLTTRDG